MLERATRINGLIDRLVELHARVEIYRKEIPQVAPPGLDTARTGMEAELKEIDSDISKGQEVQAESRLIDYDGANNARKPLLLRLLDVRNKFEGAGDVPPRTRLTLQDIESNIFHRNYRAADTALQELEVESATLVPKPRPEHVTCNLCGAAVGPNQSTCPSCGHDPRSETRECPRCGKVVLTTFSHCPFCGTSIP
jgi:hypothetical protein